jgi:hypothetical protein
VKKKGPRKRYYFEYFTISPLALEYNVLYPEAIQYIAIKDEV